ncbi:MAG: hypothetical protein ACJ8J0_01170 [Longimicrobiaceae bacterium]
MRIQLLVLAVLAAGCRPASPPAAPEPLPSPAAPAPPPQQPPPPVGIVDGYLTTCVVRNGRMEEVKIEYDTQRGDTTYQGRPFSAAFPVDSTFALNADWYRESVISSMWGRYLKYGQPRILGTSDVVPIGTFRGVTVFAEPGVNRERPLVIYLPVRPVCEFQPYIPIGVK